VTNLPFHDGHESPPTPNGAKGKPRCRRHDWETVQGEEGQLIEWCARCRHERDFTSTRRGRTNRSRGNAIERDVARHLGLRRVGQFGGKEDVSGDLWAAQVKSGGSFSERYWGWLKSVPVNASQVQLLVVTDAPGPGHKRRAIVVLDLDDWADLHGPGAA
jgi:hypothetical protein